MIFARLGRLLLASAVAVCALFLGGTAAAHGRFPNAGLVLRHPVEQNRLLVRSTFGLLHSEDAGGRWLWSCPEAVGWDADLEDPAVVFTGSRIVAGTFEGLAISSEDACGWSFLDGEAQGRFFRDVVLMDPAHLLAVASNGLGGDQFDVDVWQSSDAGESWSQVAMAPPSDFLAVAITAPADGSHIYLSGRDGVGSYEGALYRSDDGGDSWQRLAVPGTVGGARVPYLAGVHPQAPDTVYVASIAVMGLEVVSFELMVSEDAGETFTTFFERDRGVSGFALSPDGTRVAVGGREDGLWIGGTDTHQLAQVNQLEVGCLAWHPEGIYACGNQFTDGFTLGFSQDDGVTFETLMQLDSPCGPLECAAGTLIGDTCPALWEIERQEINAGMCAVPPPDDGSCDCTVAAPVQGSQPRTWLYLFAAALLFARRRRLFTSPGGTPAGKLMLAVLIWAFALLTHISPARANGKFPEAGQLVIHPSEPARIAVRTTFGVLVTADGGAEWDVICEQGAGYVDIEPAIAVASSGALALGLYEGVATSSDDGCDWSLASGITEFARDLTTSRSDPANVLAISYDASTQQSRCWSSPDNAATFTETAAQPEQGFIALTVEVAPSDPGRIYLSGVRGDPQQGALARSADGGGMWEVVTITGSDATSWPYIGAVDPTNPDVVYLRLHSDPGRLLRTEDAGNTWAEVFSTPGFLRGLALSPDGTQLAIGADDGIWRAPTSTLAFEKVSETAALCLTWHDQGLFACGHQFLNDGFAVAVSSDAGVTFDPLVSFNCIRGVLDCSEGTSVAQACPAEWPMLSAQLMTDSCGAAPATSSTVASTASSSGGGHDEGPTASSGCGCRMVRARTGGLGLLLGLLLILSWRRRRTAIEGGQVS